jgi:DNA-directed RNA polymerase specialized sigma24 family protein
MWPGLRREPARARLDDLDSFSASHRCGRASRPGPGSANGNPALHQKPAANGLLQRGADPVGFVDEESLPEHGETPFCAAERDELERAIGKLPPRARAVLVLHDVEGWRHEEIANELVMAVGSSKAQLHRARGLLRKALGDV